MRRDACTTFLPFQLYQCSLPLVDQGTIPTRSRNGWLTDHPMETCQKKRGRPPTLSLVMAQLHIFCPRVLLRPGYAEYLFRVLHYRRSYPFSSSGASRFSNRGPLGPMPLYKSGFGSGGRLDLGQPYQAHFLTRLKRGVIFSLIKVNRNLCQPQI